MVLQGCEFKPEIVLEETAIQLRRNAEGYTLVTSRGSMYPTKTLIISAGAGAFSPTRIGVDREEDFEGRGLYYGVREKAIFSGKRIAIVGGGDSAFDWALNLEPIASHIYLIHRRDQFRAHEDSIRQVMDSRVEKKLFCTVKELHGEVMLNGITIENSQTGQRERLSLDAVIVNVGFKSSLGPIKEWGLQIEKNQVVVDRFYETNLPGVFAVGDVCTFEGKLKLIATGVGEAVTAVCIAKTRLDPAAKLFPGHSSDMELGLG
jgi:ferredoxin/flavodoxin---NADP+ reductase